eukprot:2530842-Prymnesium_polylepis.1
MRYGDALRILARLEGVPEAHIEALVCSKFEYMVTSQIYFKLKNSAKADDNWKAQAIDELRNTFAANLKVAYVEGDAGKQNEAFHSVLLGVDENADADENSDRVVYK